MCWWHNHSGYLRINDLQSTKKHSSTYQMRNYCARKEVGGGGGWGEENASF